MSDPSADRRADGTGPTVADALDRDAARIGAELMRLDGGTDPFAAAVRATRMPMIVSDPRQPDNPVVFVNDAFCRLTGYARDEILGRNCRFLQGVGTDRAVVARIGAAVRAARPIEIDVLNYRKDGEAFWNRLLLAPVRDAAGDLAYFFASQVDVTLERERLAGLESRNAALMAQLADRMRALVESEARFRHMANSAPALIWMTDAEGAVSFVNRHHEHMFGVPGETLLGKGWARLILPEDRPGVGAAFRAAFAARVPFQAELRVCDGAGRIRWLRCDGVPRRDDAGGFLGYTGCNLDITEARLASGALEARVAERTADLRHAIAELHHEVAERERAEEALRQAQKMEAVGQLTGGIAHDFNNMLQGVTGALAMARRRLASGSAEEATRYIEAANDAALRAAGLTRRLLAFARRQRLEPRVVDPDALVSGMAELVRRTVGPAIEVELRLGAPGTVLCDPNELESAILNLCINARDAMPDGGQLVLATAARWLSPAEVAGDDGMTAGEHVEIRVADSGTGMPPEILRRITEPFFTTKPQGQGTGLGVSQVYGFVRQSGGQLGLESAVGRGTAVRLLLPRQDGPAAANENRPAATPDEQRVGGLVLLVDDEAGVRRPTAERLRELGLDVVEAADGPAALRLLDGGLAPDLLVTDVGLPGGLDGGALAEGLRRRWPGLPVLFISGYAGDTALIGAEVIGKPFDLDAFAARAAAALEESGRRARVRLRGNGAERGRP